jgi:hypothetical protein
MITLGHPGYANTRFSWEHSFVKEVIQFYGIEMVISEEAAYSGQSGGAALSVANGKVLGMVDAGMEIVAWQQPPVHTHVSISMFVSANEILAFLRS